MAKMINGIIYDTVEDNTVFDNIVNAVKETAAIASSFKPIEYNINILNKVITDLEFLSGTEVQDITMQTTNLGDSVGKMNEYFTLYNEIHHSLQQTIKHILKTVTEVRDEASAM